MVELFIIGQLIQEKPVCLFLVILVIHIIGIHLVA